MKNRNVYIAHGDDASENELIGTVPVDATSADVEAFARECGHEPFEATDVCDATGSTTDDDEARVWIVIPA